jgi:hypothetical protein
MLKANGNSRSCFFNRLRQGCAAFAGLFLFVIFLGCYPTPEGAVDRGAVRRSPRPIDADPYSAEIIGREALGKIGYIPLINLARRAGWVTTKQIRRTPGVDRALISMDGVSAAAASDFVEVYSEYAVAAGVASQLDSPLPGPGDVAAIGILAVGLLDAGLLDGAILASLGELAGAIAGNTTSAPPVAMTTPTTTAAPVATSVPIPTAGEIEAQCWPLYLQCRKNDVQPEWNREDFGPTKKCLDCYQECKMHAKGVWPDYKCPRD